MADSICIIDGCERKRIARGWCAKHYDRWHEHGDPSVLLSRPNRPSGMNAAETFRYFMPGEPPGEADCWVWAGPINKLGYGSFVYNNGTAWALAHRLAYEIFIGPIPDGMRICHHCDHRPCVNPLHLYSGTAAQNTRDMMVRNRFGNRKLSVDDVITIRRRHATEGIPQHKLANEYGITQAHISRIVLRQAWKHID